MKKYSDVRCSVRLPTIMKNLPTVSEKNGVCLMIQS